VSVEQQDKVQGRRSGGRRARRDSAQNKPLRQTNYRQVMNPYSPMQALSEDRVAALHDTSLRVLEELGIKVLLPQARAIYAAAGVRLGDDDMVYIGRDLVEQALSTVPGSITLKGGSRLRDVEFAPGRIVMQSAGGCPYATDLKRGRRPGSFADFKELCLLTQHYDVLNLMAPVVEAQDVPNNLRHYAFMQAQLTLTDKVPFIFSRGTPQVEDSFEMLRIGRGLSDDEFKNHVWCFTVINTNSPRQIDIPMGQGLIDFARFGQVSVVTPFTLMGAMAPITPAGAMTLSHAECLAAVTLTQLVNPGAPVCYGTFTSNVDMKSGSPALGTPEQFHANLIAGQLARHVNMPWRSAGGSAAAVSDVQAAHETQMGTWGAVQAGANLIMHAAGWLEAGLSVSYEKFITDIEMLQILAESLQPVAVSEDDLAFAAIAEVAPGGHFFACEHTMQRYQTQFYDPIVHDWSNFGQWTERGALTATQRATGVWQAIVDAGSQVDIGSATMGELEEFVARRTQQGGALPES